MPARKTILELSRKYRARDKTKMGNILGSEATLKEEEELTCTYCFKVYGRDCVMHKRVSGRCVQDHERITIKRDYSFYTTNVSVIFHF